jgi:hypothetical protein
MKLLFRSFAGALLLSGCASVAVKAPPTKAPNPVPAAVAGRQVVFRANCAERFRVAPDEMTDFSTVFPGLKVEDSAFQTFVREGYSTRISSSLRSGPISLDPKPCDTTIKPAGVGFTAEGTRLLLDTTGLDTGKVYVARSPIVFVLADSSTRSSFFGKDVPETVKLIDVELSYGLFDVRNRKMIATGHVRGLSSTGAVSEPDVVRDDWYTASKRLASTLVDRIDSMLVPDSVSRR